MPGGNGSYNFNTIDLGIVADATSSTSHPDAIDTLFLPKFTIRSTHDPTQNGIDFDWPLNFS